MPPSSSITAGTTTKADDAQGDHGGQEGDQRRHTARTGGASKQRHHVDAGEDHDERLAATQRGEAKQAGADVPGPLRGKGRRNDPA